VALYEKHGVREYMLVHPNDRLITVRLVGADGKYGIPKISEAKGLLPVNTLPGLEIDLDAVFRRIGQDDKIS
jgi:Uma2 family endonuclease